MFKNINWKAVYKITSWFVYEDRHRVIKKEDIFPLVIQFLIVICFLLIASIIGAIIM